MAVADTFPAGLKRCMRAAGYDTPTELHQALIRAGIHAQYSQVHNYLSGRTTPTIQKLTAFADFFGCSMDELLGRTTTGGPHERHNDLAGNV
jgi:transcriptional regulator with XRE-family HTH domain